MLQLQSLYQSGISNLYRLYITKYVQAAFFQFEGFKAVTCWTELDQLIISVSHNFKSKYWLQLLVWYCTIYLENIMKKSC